MILSQHASLSPARINLRETRIGVRAVCDGCGGEQTAIVGAGSDDVVDSDLDTAVRSGRFTSIPGCCRACGGGALHGRRAWFVNGRRH